MKYNANDILKITDFEMLPSGAIKITQFDPNNYTAKRDTVTITQCEAKVAIEALQTLLKQSPK
jgi:hypothetical protein